jgi:hypothetical protein
MHLKILSYNRLKNRGKITNSARNGGSADKIRNCTSNTMQKTISQRSFDVFNLGVVGKITLICIFNK